MIYIQYTGKGWLTYALVPLVIVAGVLLGGAVLGTSQDRHLAAGVAAVTIAVIGGPAQWLLGRWLNGAATTPGWERAEHTTYGIPMEMAAPFYPAVGLLMLSIVVGQATSALWGWLLFLGPVAAAAALVRVARRHSR